MTLKLQEKSRIINYIIIFFILMVFKPISSTQGSALNTTMQSIPSLNVTDVRGIAHTPDYVAIYTRKTELFSQQLKKLGYEESLYSLFNFTGPLNNFTTFPKTIGTVVFLMTNNTSALEAVNSMIFSNNANQSIRVYMVNGTAYSNYNQYGKNTRIYTVRSVAVFNISVIKSPNSIMPMCIGLQMSSRCNFIQQCFCYLGGYCII